MGMFFLVIMALSGLDEKFVLFLDKDRNIGWKIALVL
jgi:hypothetical protein